jgi:hypothetical protein
MAEDDPDRRHFAKLLKVVREARCVSIQVPPGMGGHAGALGVRHREAQWAAEYRVRGGHSGRPGDR